MVQSRAVHLIRWLLLASLAISLIAALALAQNPSPQPAQAQQPTTSAARIELVGELPLEGGIHADVWGHGHFAYVGTWSGGCPGTGVQVIDLADPSQPQLASTLASHTGTSAEDVVVISASTEAFSGDLLAVGIQTCAPGGRPGVEFWDVSDPYQPVQLGFLATPGTGGVHELHLFQRDQRVFTLLAVPFSELSRAGGDFRIVEATDPSHPVQLADWGVAKDLQLSTNEARGLFPGVFAHSAFVSPDGNTAYVSYWDAGLVLLDITEPSQPTFLGRTTYEPGEEGNAHSNSVSADGKLLALADEVTQVVVRGIRVDAPASLAGTYEAAEATFTPQLAQSEPVSGELVYVGRGCPEGAPPAGAQPADLLLADPQGKIALVDRGECVFSAKLARLQEAGALAAIVVNNVDGAPIRMSSASGEASVAIPGVMIRRGDGQRLKQAVASGPVQVTLARDLLARYQDWGHLHFYDLTDPSNPIQLSTFGTERTRVDPQTGPPDDGWYTVHNPIIIGNRLYASWFADGLRVLDISDPSRPQEIASFVPPPHPDPTGRGLNPSTTMVWGVYVLGDLILLSDMNFGLYVVRLVGG